MNKKKIKIILLVALIVTCSSVITVLISDVYTINNKRTLLIDSEKEFSYNNTEKKLKSKSKDELNEEKENTEKDNTDNNKKVEVNEFAYERLKKINDSTERLYDTLELIENNFYQDVNLDEVKGSMIAGALDSLEDPYSRYFTPEEYKDFSEMNQGSYGGIGIVVTAHKSEFITVVSPIEGTPGERAELKSGDQIIKVNGNEVYSKKIDEAIDMMKGKPKTKVKLTIKREDEEFDVDIIREQIEIKSVKSRIIDEKYGYIKITSFDIKVYSEFKTALSKLLEEDIEGLIIDVRNNPGGYLDQVNKIADEILGEQLIVYTETKSGEKSEIYSDSKKIDLPLVVLVNQGSASASEILTGAIQDGKAGKIIGEKTFGKGVVQQVITLEDGSAIKLTIAQYFTPNGRYIHEKGIEPDINVKMPEEYYLLEDPKDSDDPQLMKAIEVLSE